MFLLDETPPRDHGNTLHQVRKQLSARTELLGGNVDKVAIKSQQMVTYNVQLAIGSPPQVSAADLAQAELRAGLLNIVST